MAVRNEEQHKQHYSGLEVLVAMRNLAPEQLMELFAEVNKVIDEYIDEESNNDLFLPLIVDDTAGIKIETTTITEFTDLAGISGCIGAVRIYTRFNVSHRTSGGFLEDPYRLVVSVVDLDRRHVDLIDEVCYEPGADLRWELGLEEDEEEHDHNYFLGLVDKGIYWARKWS